MNKIVIYIHGKGGLASEAEHYKPLFADSEIIGFDYRAQTPWEAQREFREFFDAVSAGADRVDLIANSIGAFFALCSLAERKIGKAYFISPVVDMEKLIRDMMMWANVSEDELREKKEIPTAFGETLSWEYLKWVREHPVTWKIPTAILYGSEDDLQSFAAVNAFAEKTHADLTVMRGGEHWFHTDEQMKFLDDWIKNEK